MKIKPKSVHLSYPEICQDISPLNIFSSQSDLPVSMVLIPLEVCQWNLKHSMFETFRSNLLKTMKEDLRHQNILYASHADLKLFINWYAIAWKTKEGTNKNPSQMVKKREQWGHRKSAFAWRTQWNKLSKLTKYSPSHTKEITNKSQNQTHTTKRKNNREI